MASIKTDLGYIHGTENLIQWVNENSNTYRIKNHGDLYYWVKLAKQKKKEGSRCLTLNASESKDGKQEGDVLWTLHNLCLRNEVFRHGKLVGA